MQESLSFLHLLKKFTDTSEISHSMFKIHRFLTTTNPNSANSQNTGQGSSSGSGDSDEFSISPTTLAFIILGAGFATALLIILFCCFYRRCRQRSRVLTTVEVEDLENLTIDANRAGPKPPKRTDSLKQIEEKLEMIDRKVKSIVLGSKPEKIPEDKLCIVCMDARASIRLEPCNHSCVCTGCMKALVGANRACPLCRTDIKNIVELPPMITRFY